MKFVNLTPHPLTIQKSDGSTVEIPPSGIVARVSQKRELVTEIEGIPVYHVAYGDVVDLPQPEADTIYIVSAMVKAAMPNFPGLYSPGELIRDENGNVVGAKGLYA